MADDLDLEGETVTLVRMSGALTAQGFGLSSTDPRAKVTSLMNWASRSSS